MSPRPAPCCECGKLTAHLFREVADPYYKCEECCDWGGGALTLG